MPGGMVGGHKFTDINDYNAALEDTKLINRLKAQTDMSDPEAVRKLYSALQSGEVRFQTAVGRDFDDELYDMIQEFDKHPEGVSDKKPQKQVKLPSIKIGVNKSTKKSTVSSNKRKAIKKSSGSGDKAADKSDNINGKDIDEAAAEIVRKANLRRRIITVAAGIVAAGSLIYFAIYSRSAYINQSAMDELASLKGTDPVAEEIEQKPLFTLAEADEIPEILDEYKNVYIKNKSVIGWLTIDGTNIDYPVMQTVNNEYYLNHDFEGDEDNNGSIFMDCNCNAMFRSTNLIVYGHHMKSGKMFGNLKKYESEEYCAEHNLIKFDTIYEKGLYEVMYVFRDTIKDAEDVSFKYYQFIDAASAEEFDSNMKSMAEMSLYDTGVTATYGDELLTLSTCNGSTSTARFVVVAKRIPNDQVTYVYSKSDK
ncbi:MAG: class B sortase [Lachnospiraceae bacterium]|nr:class B sortase [Lachnospiraceae bacterium]